MMSRLNPGPHNGVGLWPHQLTGSDIYQVLGGPAQEREAEEAEQPVWATVRLQASGAGDYQPFPEQICGG